MAIALLQSRNANPGGVSSSTLAFSSNTTAGSLLVAHIWIGNGASTMTASDNVNGAYNQDIIQQSPTHGAVSSGIFTFPNCAGGAATVTYTATGGGQLRVIIEEYSGIASTTPLDQTGNSINLNNNTNWTVTLTGATTQANELVIAHTAASNSGTFTANQIGGLAANQDSVADNSGRPSVEYLAMSSTGTFTASWTNSANLGGLCIASYKASGAPAGVILMGGICL
jgi:hypothetical protein